MNLITLMPKLAALRVYDNSAEADPAAGKAPVPLLLLHLIRGRFVESIDAPAVPEWVKPVRALHSNCTWVDGSLE